MVALCFIRHDKFTSKISTSVFLKSSFLFAIGGQAPYCQEEPQDPHVENDDGAWSKMERVQRKQPFQRHLRNCRGRGCGGCCGNGQRGPAHLY